MKISETFKKAKTMAEDLGGKAESAVKELQKQAAPIVDKTSNAIKDQFDKTKETIGDVKKNIDDKHTYNRNIILLDNSEIKLLIPDDYSKVSLKALMKEKPNEKRDAIGLQKVTDYSQNTIIMNHIPAERAMIMGDVIGLIDNTRIKLKKNQGIIEVNTGETSRGLAYVYKLIKTKNEGRPGVHYSLKMHIAKNEEVIAIKADFAEINVSGVRDSMVFDAFMANGLVSLENEEITGWSRDPYDESYQEGFLMNLSEQDEFDGMFAEYPLAQARELIQALVFDRLFVDQTQTDNGIANNNEREADETADLSKQSDSDENRSIEDTETEKLIIRRDSIVVDVDGIGVSEREKLDDKLKDAINEYNASYAAFSDKGTSLYVERHRAVDLIMNVENLINSIANHPKEFDKEIVEIQAYRQEFSGACDFARKELEEAKKSAISAGTGIAGGMAVAALAPSAAMWIATTFGTASTGTAISALSGAAATNAALAWLGGGAAAAGGGGMVAGNALLALAGPIGWSIAGATLLTTVILFANKKMEIEKQKKEEIKAVLNNSEALKEDNEKLKVILEKTTTLRESLYDYYCRSMINYGQDFLGFSKDDQIKLGSMVNVTKGLAMLLRENLLASDE